MYQSKRPRSYRDALFPRDSIDSLRNGLNVHLLDRHAMYAVPLDQSRRRRIMILLQHLAMEMQTIVVQARHMDRRDAQDMRILPFIHMPFTNLALGNQRRMPAILAETHQRVPAREQHRELVIRLRSPFLLHPYLLVVEQA